MNKDKLNESLSVMHELFTEKELENINILLFINYRKEKEMEKDLNLNEDEENAKKESDYIEKKDIIDGLYLERLPQFEKNLIRWYMIDLYGKQYVKLMHDVHAELKIWINSMD